MKMPKTRKKLEKATMRGRVQGGPGGAGVSAGGPRVPGRVQGGSRGFGRKTAKNTKPEKRSGTVWQPTTQQQPGFCAGGSRGQMAQCLQTSQVSKTPIRVTPSGWRILTTIFAISIAITSPKASPITTSVTIKLAIRAVTSHFIIVLVVASTVNITIISSAIPLLLPLLPLPLSINVTGTSAIIVSATVTATVTRLISRSVQLAK